MHGLDDVKFREVLMHDFLVYEVTWDDTGNTTAVGQHGIRECAHQTNFPTAIDHVETSCHQALPERFRSVAIARSGAKALAGKHTNSSLIRTFHNDAAGALGVLVSGETCCVRP